LGGLHDTYGRAREPGGPRCHARIWGNALVLDELELYVLRVHLVGRDDKLPLAKAARENLNVKLGLELPLELKLRGSRGFNVGLLTRGWLELHDALNSRWRLGLFRLLPLQLSILHPQFSGLTLLLLCIFVFVEKDAVEAGALPLA